MRDYGKVYTAFWTNENIRAMSDDGRMLALYLITCNHGNMLGCFRLPNAYAADDLNWSIERVSKGFSELLENGFAYRCETTFWVFIQHHLKWNRFENPNVGKAAAKLFDALPMPMPVKTLLVKALKEFSPKFPAEKITEFEKKIESFRNHFETVSKPVAVAVAVTGTVAVTKVNNTVGLEIVEQVKTIFTYWQKIMDMPKSKLDAKRKIKIANALKSYSPSDICKAIRGCARTPHNMGKNVQKIKYNDIELILRDASHIDRFIATDEQTQIGPDSEAVAKARRRAAFLGKSLNDQRTVNMES